MNLNTEDVLRGLARNWWLVLVCVIISLAAGAVSVLTTSPSYSATATLYVSTPTASTVQDLSQGNTFGQQVTKTYAQVATSAYVLDPVIRRLGLKGSTAEIAARINVDSLLDTQVLSISAKGSGPQEASRLADAVARQLITAVSSLNSTRSGAAVQVTQLQDASTAVQLTAPLVGRTLSLSTLLGLALGVVAAVLRGQFDTRLRNRDDVSRASDMPSLGYVVFDEEFRTDPLLMSATSSLSRKALESFKALRTSLQYVALNNPTKQIVVTSSVPGEGKTTTVTNLAIAVAAAGRRVLLIDADLRRPRVADVFGLPNGLGLSDVLVGAETVESTIHHWGVDGLHVLTSGPIPPNPTELLQSDAMARMLHDLRSEYDFVLIDSPPALAVVDSAIIAAMVDGALVIVGLSIARRHQLRRTFESLSAVSARILGTVTTRERTRFTNSYDYTYAYRDERKVKADALSQDEDTSSELSPR